MKITIAIDGPSSSGKSTMAKALAKELGYIYVDTGAMYRAVTLCAMRHHLFSAGGTLDEEGLRSLLPSVQIGFRREKSGLRTLLCGEDVEDEIRSLEVSNRVSIVAAVPFVREALVLMQQQMGRDKGVVMDGRDIGTTVFPDAELKVFLTASPEVRAERRYRELQGKGVQCSFDEVKANVLERDHIDSTREISPLRQATDARVLDNSNMPMPEQVRCLVEWAQAAGATQHL